jgi:hypothetical protein
VDAAATARAAGADGVRAVALAEAVIVVHRFAGGFADQVLRGRTADLLREADAAVDATDPRAAAVLATARAWEHGRAEARADPDLARVAVSAARRAGEPHLVAGALDAFGCAATQAGRMREAHRLATDRLRIVDALPRHEPLAAIEVIDAYYVAGAAALAVGDLAAALAVGQRVDIGAEHPYLGLQVVQALVLSGRFPEAVARASTMWRNWQRDGSPAREWLSPHAAAAALAHGMLGEPEHARTWRARACELARVDDPADSPVLAAPAAFVDARVAVHTGGSTGAADLVDRAYASFGRPWHEGYARVAGAELAVVAGLPDAADRLAAAERYGPENAWAAACLSRAHGRHDGDPAAIAAAAAGFERIGARAERACTLLLVPGRADEGRAELRALGCALPGGPAAQI